MTCHDMAPTDSERLSCEKIVFLYLLFHWERLPLCLETCMWVWSSCQELCSRWSLFVVPDIVCQSGIYPPQLKKTEESEKHFTGLHVLPQCVHQILLLTAHAYMTCETLTNKPAQTVHAWSDNSRICIEEVAKLVYDFWIYRPVILHEQETF